MILMKTDPESIASLPISYMVGDAQILSAISEQKPLPPFAERTIELLAALSGALRNKRAHAMPDVAAFAFWCRRAALENMKGKYCRGKGRRLGRGVCIHFTPSNIPDLFAFSMSAGLLSGCSVILRLARKTSVQEDLICGELKELLDTEFSDFKPRIVLCRYGHEKEITDLLCSMSDARVLWGSDESVNDIKRSLLPARGVDLPFAARASAAVISAKEVLGTDQLDLVAKAFYNDTYLNDQNACSSPRIVYWMGSEEDTRKARDLFWGQMEALLKERGYQVPAETAVRKLESALILAAACGAQKISGAGTSLVRVQIPKLSPQVWEHTAAGGLFIESRGQDLAGLDSVLDKTCQTVCTVGVDEQLIADFVLEHRLSGVDRIVPVGHTLDFALTWDGIDMIDAMSRTITGGR